MWTVLSVVVGALLAVSAAFGLVASQGASKTPINAPLIQYGSQ